MLAVSCQQSSIQRCHQFETADKFWQRTLASWQVSTLCLLSYPRVYLLIVSRKLVSATCLIAGHYCCRTAVVPTAC